MFTSDDITSIANKFYMQRCIEITQLSNA